jgi:4-carboxymuconolactone decarboxylase
MSDSDGSGRFAQGLQIRKDVLGAEHVERSLEAASEFARPLQDLVTEYCWGAVWGRPGLDRRTRSIINIAMLSALNRQHELGVHVRGAIRNGCTVEEIRETILQIAVYCGVPSAIEASRTAEAALRDFSPDGDRPSDGRRE